MIVYQIYRNLHEPGLKAAVAAKFLLTHTGAQKTVLRDRLGSIPVPQGRERETKDPRAVLLNHFFEVQLFPPGIHHVL